MLSILLQYCNFKINKFANSRKKIIKKNSSYLKTLCNGHIGALLLFIRLHTYIIQKNG